VGDKVAVSVEGITIGRQVAEGDVLLAELTESQFRNLKAKRELLGQAEINVLKEIAEIKRKEKETWGL
jgi:translation initiation factor 5B